MHVRPGVQQKLQHTNFKHLSTDASEINLKNPIEIEKLKDHITNEEL